MIRPVLLSLGMVALAGANAAHAAPTAPLQTPNPVFDNFGPAHTYLCCWGGNVAGVTTNSPEMEAAAFTPAGNQTVHHIAVGLGLVSGDDAAVVSLYTDNAGLPGTDITDGVILGGMPSFTLSNNAIVTASIPATPLIGGTQYWLVVWEDTANTVSVWNYSPRYQGSPGATAFCSGGNSCTWTAYPSIPANQMFAFKVW